MRRKAYRGHFSPAYWIADENAKPLILWAICGASGCRIRKIQVSGSSIHLGLSLSREDPGLPRRAPWQGGFECKLIRRVTMRAWPR
jgi:hypothetical protein